jgi:hypothetical protein
MCQQYCFLTLQLVLAAPSAQGKMHPDPVRIWMNRHGVTISHGQPSTSSVSVRAHADADADHSFALVKA